MHVIGEESSERLDVIPAQYRVIVTHRPEYACRACERIVEAPAPEHLIKSGLPTEAMVASVLVAKYAGTFLCTARPKCSPPKASISTARHWRSGLAMRPRS
jgi:hypothetical protein